jgi:hypothetical protein
MSYTGFSNMGIRRYYYFVSHDLVSLNNKTDYQSIKETADPLRRIYAGFIFREAHEDESGFFPAQHDTYYASIDTPESATDFPGRSVIRQTTRCNEIAFAETNLAMFQNISSNIVVPNIKIPIRLYNNIDGNLKGDVAWRTFFMGGSWGTEEFIKKINPGRIFYDSSFYLRTDTGYKVREFSDAMSTSSDIDPGGFNITSNYYDYDQYVQNYQTWASSLETELLIPNFNVLTEYGRLVDEDYEKLEAEALGTDTSDITMEQQQSYSKQRTETILYHVPVTDTYIKDLEKNQYLGSYFVNTEDNKGYKSAAISAQQNIIFDKNYFDYLENESIDITAYPEVTYSTLGDYSSWVHTKANPFYSIDINFKRHANTEWDSIVAEDTTYDEETGLDYLWYDHRTWEPQNNTLRLTKLIEQSNCSSMLLEILKDIDEGQLTEVQTTEMPFHYSVQKQTLNPTNPRSAASKYQTESPEEPVGLKSINFLDLLFNMYQNYDVAENDNFLFMGPPTPEQAALYNRDTMYRNLNSLNLSHLIDGTLDTVSAYMRGIDPRQTAPSSPTPVDWSTPSSHELLFKRLIDPKPKINEVIAYKIEKRPATPTGDSNTSDVIQKFWVFNATNAPDYVRIIDSQVKFDKNYTYKISAYVLTMTHKYKYDDLRLTKQIGAAKYIEDTAFDVQYCLQFYDPETEGNDVAAALLNNADRSADALEAARSILAGMTKYAPNSVELSGYPQAADFNVYFEPCLKLIEIPLYEKTTKVMDNPSSQINVTPFHFVDGNNKIGFQIGQESFIHRDYPQIVTIADSLTRKQYFSSKEIVDPTEVKGSVSFPTEEAYKLGRKATIVQNMSESPSRVVEMYRIKTKPNSYIDFNDNLVATVDLRIKNDIFNYSNKIVSDEILPNTKYYYLFRMVSENKMPGHVSQIIEVELVNDGGYTYTIFDVVDTSEFNPNKTTTNEVQFKKLLQLKPNIQHLQLDDTEVSYDDYASNQIDNLIVGTADDKIWDKKFKVRLTSKKTNRKIDLNVTFNLINRDLSKIAEATKLLPSDAEILSVAGYLGYDTDAFLDIDPELIEYEALSESSTADPVGVGAVSHPEPVAPEAETAEPTAEPAPAPEEETDTTSGSDDDESGAVEGTDIDEEPAADAIPVADGSDDADDTATGAETTSAPVIVKDKVITSVDDPSLRTVFEDFDGAACPGLGLPQTAYIRMFSAAEAAAQYAVSESGYWDTDTWAFVTSKRNTGQAGLINRVFTMLHSDSSVAHKINMTPGLTVMTCWYAYMLIGLKGKTVGKTKGLYSKWFPVNRAIGGSEYWQHMAETFETFRAGATNTWSVGKKVPPYKFTLGEAAPDDYLEHMALRQFFPGTTSHGLALDWTGDESTAPTILYDSAATVGYVASFASEAYGKEIVLS